MGKLKKITEINGRTAQQYKDLLVHCDALKKEDDALQIEIQKILTVFRQFILEYAKYKDNKKYDVSDFAELINEFNKWADRNPSSC